MIPSAESVPGGPISCLLEDDPSLQEDSPSNPIIARRMLIFRYRVFILFSCRTPRLTGSGSRAEGSKYGEGDGRIIYLSPSRQDRRDTLSLRKSIDRSRDTIFHHRLAKVQQVTESHAGELQIRQELLLVGVVDTLN